MPQHEELEIKVEYQQYYCKVEDNVWEKMHSYIKTEVGKSTVTERTKSSTKYRHSNKRSGCSYESRALSLTKYSIG